MRNTILLALVASALSACSLDRVALRRVVGVLEHGRIAALDEPDWQTGREAMSSQLELLEMLLANDPTDRTLLRLAEEGYGGSAFVFLEDAEPSRAKGFYLRGRDRALAALALKPAFRSLSAKTFEDLESTLRAATKDDVPDLFWAGFCWGGYINLSKDDASALGDLPKVTAVMKRVMELDPSYRFSSVDLFFGVYYASRPPLLGGDPQKAKGHFDAAHKSTKGLYLMAHVLKARWYAVAVQDRELFKQLLTKTLESPSGQLPEARLTDEAAKRKAAALLEKIDDYF